MAGQMQDAARTETDAATDIYCLCLDLVGSTKFGRELRAHQLERFNRMLVEQIRPHLEALELREAVLKFTGDGWLVMAEVPRLNALCCLGLLMVQLFEKEMAEGTGLAGVPQLRAAVCQGKDVAVALPDGRTDWVGDSARRATRAALLCRPGEVLVSGPVNGNVDRDFATQPVADLDQRMERAGNPKWEENIPLHILAGMKALDDTDQDCPPCFIHTLRVLGQPAEAARLADAAADRTDEAVREKRATKPEATARYNSLITAESDYAEVVKWLTRMEREGVAPDDETYARLLELSPDEAEAQRWAPLIEDLDTAARTAKALGERGSTLREMGRRSDSLRALTSALVLSRRLAETNPEAFRQYVASTLNNRGNVLSDMGQREEAYAALTEALGLYRQLAGAHPETYQARLAATLLNHGGALWAMGRASDALGAYDAALRIRRDLVRETPNTYSSGLALALVGRALALSKLGRRDEALADSEEAVAVLRDALATNDDRAKASLALALSNRSNLLRLMGTPKEALVACDEALGLYRQLAEIEPEAYQPRVASTLNNRGNALAALDRHQDALAAYEEALAIRRQLAEREPEAFRAEVADTLTNRGYLLGLMGRPDEARADLTEAEGIYAELAEDEPLAFGDALERARRNLRRLDQPPGDLFGAFPDLDPTDLREKTDREL